MRLGSFGASILIHALVLGMFILPGGRRTPRRPPPPVNPPLVLIELAKLQPKVQIPDHGTIRYPKKKKPPLKVAEKPEVKPTPKPSPTSTPDPNHKVFDALRRYQQFAHLTDEQIRNLPMPPGMKDWKDVLAMTQSLDKLDWTQAPPDTGDHAASTSTGGFFGWAPAQLDSSAEYFGSGGAKREFSGGQWRFAFQYFGTVLVAEWKEGTPVAKVAYYQMGAKPDATKTFDVLLKPTDEELTGEMLAQFTLISMGQPPVPVSAMNGSTH